MPPAAGIGADGHIAHLRQAQAVVIVELAHGIIDRWHAHNARDARRARALMAVRADIAPLAPVFVALGLGGFQQVHWHPHIGLNTQEHMSAHDIPGHTHPLELAHIGRHALHERKAQDIVEACAGRALPRLKVGRRRARKRGGTALLLEPLAQRGLVLVVVLDVHCSATVRKPGRFDGIVRPALGVPAVLATQHECTVIARVIGEIEFVGPGNPAIGAAGGPMQPSAGI